MPLVLERLGAEIVVGMLGLIDGFARDAITLAGPSAEIGHLASLGAERPKAIGRRHVDGPLANRASHLKEKLPKLLTVCNKRQKTSVLPQCEVPPAWRKVLVWKS